MLNKAKGLMHKFKVRFIVTGEVVGQRPMSQYKHTLRLIDKQAKLQGLILRPLSAKIIEPTIPEEKGWVDRNKFFDFNGRSRRPQIELAKRFKIKDIPGSAGGCLLTDQGFSRRMKDLLGYCDAGLNDVEMLKLGRHFRLNKNTKLIVGRDQQENNLLIKLIRPTDIIFEPEKKNGPVALGRGDFQNDSLIDLACKIIARYCNGDERPKINIEIKDKPFSKNLSRQVLPLEENTLEKLRI